ncbi:MOSC domain-containing protein [Thermoactinomyces sp. CICC 10522]|uniref:MOSC domain-containing protein n=1 Tax=Thermoactinomyces sp. CICC 10522 TaxID=2767427 RepID=UPI0018DC2AA7|nr:MOSC domain-containing protein [Thermoactinomyces sp. CICC 10522]MBH8605183.1 MOSC domain-containing protein [Thermoactinomyces sp. CICC 10522]
MLATLKTVLVGKTKTFLFPLEGKPWHSAINKTETEGAVWLGRTKLEGDDQADLKHHGGPEKAVLGYADSHYPLWRQELNLSDFTYGAFGENFVITDQTEETVCIGDIYQIGKAILQISQPRIPCWKPARLWGIDDLTKRMETTGRTGWYFRVLQEGEVQAGEQVRLLDRPHSEWTVSKCNDLLHHKKGDQKAFLELAACPALAESWRNMLTKLAARM